MRYTFSLHPATVPCALLCGLVFLLLTGCGGTGVAPHARIPFSLDELVLRVGSEPRGYVLSDRAGGFLFGVAGRDSAFSRDLWGVLGREVGSRITVMMDGRDLEGPTDSILIRPDRVERWFPEGVRVTMTLVDFPGKRGSVHGLHVTVLAAGRHSYRVTLTPGSAGSSVVAAGGSGNHAEGLTVSGEDCPEGDALFVAGGEHLTAAEVPVLPSQALAREASMKERLERLLNAAYLRLSDHRLTAAIAWCRLSLDGLVVRGQDTLAVSGIPWDGSWSGRDNAQALSGLAVLGDSGETARGMIHTLSLLQDTVPGSRTFGRLPGHFTGARRSYSDIDVGPSLVRGMYELISVTNDTLLVPRYWPMVRRSIEGIRSHSVDRENLLTHARGETWMGQVDRGNRAVELQQLWQFEQMIGGYVAANLGDTARSSLFLRGAVETARAFQSRFIDTVSLMVYDHLDAQGRGSPVRRPNAIMVLELVPSVLIQRNVVTSVVGSVAYPHGVGTLAAGEPGFLSAPGDQPGTRTQGAVWTWLTGPLVYALSRFDAQDIAYRITQDHVDRILDHGVAGTLPEMLEARPGTEGAMSPDAGRSSSLTGQAEFLRTLYQDYLGVRADGSTNELTLQPKLPRQVSTMDATVRVGEASVNVRYENREPYSRIVVLGHGHLRPLRIRLLWVLPGGDAWRGGIDVPADHEVVIVVGVDEMFARMDEKRVAVTGGVKIRGFSQRQDLGALALAPR